MINPQLLIYLAPFYLFLLFAMIAIWIFINRAKKTRELPPIEEVTWKYGEQELTIIYNKNHGPLQAVIDGIKQDLPKLEALVLDYIKQTNVFKEETKDGILLEGFSFPVFEEEKDTYDFSLDFCLTKDKNKSIVATIKNGVILKLMMGE